MLHSSWAPKKTLTNSTGWVSRKETSGKLTEIVFLLEWCGPKCILCQSFQGQKALKDLRREERKRMSPHGDLHLRNGCHHCPVPTDAPAALCPLMEHLPLLPCSLQQTTSSSNSCVEGQSFLSYHMKEIPACSAVDYVRQHVIHSQQVMTLIHSLDWICSQ